MISESHMVSDCHPIWCKQTNEIQIKSEVYTQIQTSHTTLFVHVSFTRFIQLRFDHPKTSYPESFYGDCYLINHNKRQLNTKY